MTRPEPERPRHTHLEKELLKPRQGIRMAVQICNSRGEPLRPTEDIIDYAELRAKLSVEQTDSVHERKFTPDIDREPLAEAALTVYTFCLSDSPKKADPRFERDFNQFIRQVANKIPPDERSIYLDFATVPGEALHPALLGKGNIFQFILTRDQGPRNKS